MNYIALRIDATPCNEDITDLLADALAPFGYESFTSDETGLTAYIAENQFCEQDIKSAIEDFPIPTNLTYSQEFIEGKDWNEEWEKNYFKPILIDGKCLIHSSFHTDLPEARYRIVIDPKMAFGTGHHFTTSLIVRKLLELDLTDKSVIDMGTGTGILAILALMRNAKSAIGIEIDPSAYENAIENCKLNNSEVQLINGDASSLSNLSPADVFIANINRNIILADISSYAEALKPGGIMLLSGFYTGDVPLLEKAAAHFQLTSIDMRADNDWTMLALRKES